MRLTILLVASLLALSPGGAKDKRQLSDEEIQTAYNVAVNKISTLLKAPATAVYAPIKEARFKPLRGNQIAVDLYVDAQNSFGAMVRESWGCSVSPQRDNGLYNAWCYGRPR